MRQIANAEFQIPKLSSSTFGIRHSKFGSVCPKTPRFTIGQKEDKQISNAEFQIPKLSTSAFGIWKLRFGIGSGTVNGQRRL
jgi:hypothetical protein